MLICDTHADTLWALAVRRERPEAPPLDITHAYLTATRDTRVQALALFVCTGGMEQQPTIVERELRALEELKAQGFRQITDISDALPGRANVILTIEGGEAFGDDPNNVNRFAALGVCAAALLWNNENRLGHPAIGGNPSGLTPFGREVVLRMQACRMAVDVSHLNPRGVQDVLSLGCVPMASHSCARALCDHPRNLTDDQLRAIFRAGGFVGVNFYPRFLTSNAHATIDHVIDHMAHMCALGGEGHTGIGSDFDGIDDHPEGLRNAADIPFLLNRMLQRGFSLSLVEGIAGQNFHRYFQGMISQTREPPARTDKMWQ